MTQPTAIGLSCGLRPWSEPPPPEVSLPPRPRRSRVWRLVAQFVLDYNRY